MQEKLKFCKMKNRSVARQHKETPLEGDPNDFGIKVNKFLIRLKHKDLRPGMNSHFESRKGSQYNNKRETSERYGYGYCSPVSPFKRR